MKQSALAALVFWVLIGAAPEPAKADPCDQFETSQMAVSIWSWETDKPGERRATICKATRQDRARVREALKGTGDYWKGYCPKEVGFIARQLDEIEARCMPANLYPTQAEIEVEEAAAEEELARSERASELNRQNLIFALFIITFALACGYVIYRSNQKDKEHEGKPTSKPNI